ncbi:MAG: helix-turn-helix domain-containing protein [Bifidobacteriaceae bacterium]|jgi:hypothetical protein|nr:helix-turn-helix domain-containing protein [Bifidobacteriaceae bacterium]
MKLSLPVIADELRHRGVHADVGEQARRRAFNGVRLLPAGGPLDPDYLYLCPSGRDPSDPAALGSGPGYVTIGPRGDVPPGPCLTLPAHTDPLIALAVISETFDRYAEWELELMALANGGHSTDEMLLRAEDVLGNPAIAYDAMLRPLADGRRLAALFGELISEPYRLSASGDWLASDLWVRRLEKSGLLTALRENPTAFVFRGFSMPFIAANLEINGHTAGFLTIPPLRAPLEPRNLAEADILARCLSQALERQLLRQASTLEPSVVPTLNMLLSESEHQLMQLARRGWSRHDHYSVLVIKSETNLRATDCYQELFRRLFAGCQVIVGRTILVVVFRDRPTARIRSELGTLSAVLRNNGLIGGVSMDFTDFLEIRAFYAQAHTAADAVRPDAGGPPVIFYEDHLSDHLTSVFSQQFRQECHILPRVRALAAYDADHGATLLDTLFAYLTHDRSHDASAERLHIHKSTLKYRLSRIRELAGEECFSPDQRLNVLNSIKMARAPRRPVAAPDLAPAPAQLANG